MAKGYWITRVDVGNIGRYQAYIAANAEPIKAFGGKFLVRGGKFESLEGSSRARNVVVEFPSYQAALDCWKSPGYQYAISLRKNIATFDLIVIEGLDTPDSGTT